MSGRRDFLAFAAGAVAAKTVLPAVVGTDTVFNPDADLIRLCEQHDQNRRASNADLEDADDDNALWLAYLDTKYAIDAAQPQTMAGMIAKARAAKGEAAAPDGSECPENGPAARWAWDLVNDLLRLHGRAST